MRSNELFEEHWDIEVYHASSLQEAGHDAATSLAADDNEMEAEEESGAESVSAQLSPYSLNSTDTMTDHQRRRSVRGRLYRILDRRDPVLRDRIHRRTRTCSCGFR